MDQSTKTKVSCPECPRVLLHEDMKRNHNNLYRQMMSNGQLSSPSCEKIPSRVSSQGQPRTCEDFNSARRSKETFGVVKRTENLICDQSFIELSTLKTHQDVPTKEKPFQCQQCDKSFSQISILNRHQRVHTGEKPFVCKQCDKGFSESGSLKKHQRVHTGEKPFVCKQCDKGSNSLVS